MIVAPDTGGLTDKLTHCPWSLVPETTDPETHIPTDTTRKLGLVVVRGTQVSLVAPQEGAEEIANPFIAADEEE